MTDLAVPMNVKRKDVEVVASHGFSIFLDPKRIKLQLQDDKVVDMMEEDEPLEHAPTVIATTPTIFHDKVNVVSVAVGISSEPPSKVRQDQSTAAPAPAPAAMDMEMEEDTQPYQPCRNASFFSGFF